MTIPEAKAHPLRGKLSRKITAAALAATSAAAIIALAAPAQAATWVVSGPVRATYAAASSDVAAVEADCRRQDGHMYGSGVTTGTSASSGKRIYYAYANCQSKRG